MHLSTWSSNASWPEPSVGSVRLGTASAPHRSEPFPVGPAAAQPDAEAEAWQRRRSRCRPHPRADPLRPWAQEHLARRLEEGPQQG